MEEDTFNMAIRRFLKEVGVTSQREIEIAVRKAFESGRIDGSKPLAIRAVVTIDEVDLQHQVTGALELQ